MPGQYVKKNVSIAEEVAQELPRLSTPRQIKTAMKGEWSFLRARLDDFLGKPTNYRNETTFKQKSFLGNFLLRQDDFLYLLILTHLEGDVETIIQREGVDLVVWIADFKRVLEKRSLQRFPGLV